MKKQDRPDILLIVLDTLRRDHLSGYGYSQETSPQLDAFAADATVFERAVSPAQWTIPAHASMFTGLYPTTHNLTQANGKLSGSYPALAEILQIGGYHTVGFCNNPLVGVLNNDLQRGFKQFYNYAGAAPNRPLVTRKESLIPWRLSKVWRRFARRVSNQFARNDWLFRVSLHPTLTPIWTRTINYKGHTAQSIDDMMAYLNHRWQNGSDKPLFGFLNLMETHLPYRPPQDFLDRFGHDLSRADYRFMTQFNADAARWASPADPPLPEDEHAVIDRFYDAEIAYQDYHLGKLLDWLGKSGRLEKTMVIITADHGEGHGDHEFFGHSFVVYQELVHVPLIVRHPAGFPAGERIRTNVSTRRIFHTILDAAGLTPPLDEADPNGNVAELSLRASLNGKMDGDHGVAFAEAVPPGTFISLLQHRKPHLVERLRLTQTRRAMVQGDHKLTMVGDTVEGLYKVDDDPAEVSNLAENDTDVTQPMKAGIDTFVQQAISQRAESAFSQAQVNDEVIENLRALGYIE